MTKTTEWEYCSWCGREFRDNEQPYEDEEGVCGNSGDPLCYDCWNENYQFVCCWCQEHGLKKHQHKMLVVAEADRVSTLHRDVPEGVYRITKTPYYASGIISSRLYGDAIERLTDLPEGIDTGWYPCGHLCENCQAKIEKEVHA